VSASADSRIEEGRLPQKPGGGEGEANRGMAPSDDVLQALQVSCGAVRSHHRQLAVAVLTEAQHEPREPTDRGRIDPRGEGGRQPPVRPHLVLQHQPGEAYATGERATWSD
jgi:hypothetical protein